MPDRSLLALIALFAACGSDEGSPNSPPPNNSLAGVVIAPSEVELLPGSSQTLQVQVRDTNGNLVSAPSVAWRSTDAGVATVSSAGVVQAASTGTANIIATSGTAADTAIVRVAPASVAGSWIEVFPNVEFQEITGWEGVAQIGEADCNQFSSYKDEVIERLVNELGINRVRLETRAGHENSQDFYGNFLVNRNEAQWHAGRYNAVNDNNDPNVARADGFKFSELDHKVQVIIGPMRSKLAARGERLYVNLNYVDFGTSAFEHASNVAEYAELILEAFKHLQTRYGWVPDAVEIILEPDNTPNWKPQVIGAAIVATGDRLKAAGFRPAFIAPSTTNMANALVYLDAVLAVPRVTEYLTDVAYHRYSGVSNSTVKSIAQRASQYGLRTSMLEKIGAGYPELHEDLKDGRNSSWEQYTLAFCGSVNSLGSYYHVNDDVNPPQLSMKSQTPYLRQYFTHVRLGAHRVAAISGDSRLDPLAFRNMDGKVVTIVKASGAAPVELRKLPAGQYGITLTTANQTWASLPDATVGAGGTLQFSMPAAGVVTIYRR